MGTIIISIGQKRELRLREGDNPGHMTNRRKDRDSDAISQLKSRALFTASTLTAASVTFLDCQGFTE